MINIYIYIMYKYVLRTVKQLSLCYLAKALLNRITSQTVFANYILTIVET